MSRSSSSPDLDDFARWVARKFKDPSVNTTETATRERYQKLLAAARSARDEMLQGRKSRAMGPNVGRVEVLQLMAAADKSDSTRPPELTTARGFRVALAYDDGGGSSSASICVLVQCPPELIESTQGQTAYLWNGAERFELGQFDSDGKAIGTLPAGIEISLSDFAAGKVKLEEPTPPADG
jgi:hypothetical protein